MTTLGRRVLLWMIPLDLFLVAWVALMATLIGARRRPTSATT